MSRYLARVNFGEINFFLSNTIAIELIKIENENREESPVFRRTKDVHQILLSLLPLRETLVAELFLLASGQKSSLRRYCTTGFCGWPSTRNSDINISRVTLPLSLLYDCTDVPAGTLNGGSGRSPTNKPLGTLCFIMETRKCVSAYTLWGRTGLSEQPEQKGNSKYTRSAVDAKRLDRRTFLRSFLAAKIR